MNYIIVCWPESQELFGLDGFREHCRLIDGNRGQDEFGSSAYLVPTSWLKNPVEITGNQELKTVTDEELIVLGIL